MVSGPPPTGWYLDPTGLSDGRYWDGAVWTAVVTRAGVTDTDPMDPTRAAVPPLPGTSIRAPITGSSTATQGDRSAVTIGIGVMVAALVVFLLIAIISRSGSEETPPEVDTPTATAPSATDSVEGG